MSAAADIGALRAQSFPSISLTRAFGAAIELAELRYAQGDLGFLELLDVRGNLFAARIELVSARRDAPLNTVNHVSASGGQLGSQASMVDTK